MLSIDNPNNYYYDPASSPRRRPSRILPAVIALAIFLGGGIGGYFLGKTGAGTGYIPFEPGSGQSAGNIPAGSSSADWNKLNTIKQSIYELYDGPIEESKLLEGAVKGMVGALEDPYSQFYSQKDFAALNEQGSGKFIGVGIQVGTKDGSIIVIAPIDGGPAKEAGIQSGDIIYMVDDKIYADKDIDAAVTYMRGEAGKPVTITVKRGTEELAFTIIRREITVAPIKSEILPDNMGLITLTQFTKDSDQLFVNALDDLKAQGARGYIIDLRGNPGGYLDESINIASNFIERGKVVVSTIDKHGKKIEDVSKGGNYIGVPLVVLIDEGSASASEVVAGALRDYNAAELVGVKSFGKGIVQQVMELPGGEGLKLTVAAYYSPNGTNIHKIGIEPDIAVELPEDLTGANYTRELDTQLQTAIEELSKRMAQ